VASRDDALERLLDLEAEVGGGIWITIVAQRVPADIDRPHGVSYSLTLHEPSGRRVFGIDNAIQCRRGAGRPAVARRQGIICIVTSRCDPTPTAAPNQCLKISGVRSMPS
jgi:hypothetical protein